MMERVKRYLSALILLTFCNAPLPVFSEGTRGQQASTHEHGKGLCCHTTSTRSEKRLRFDTAREYLIQFYPLWFTFFQSNLAAKNRLVGPDRISPLYQTVVAINDDTLYASTVIDLSIEPVIFTIPATTTTYSILTLDQFGNVFPSGIPEQTAGVFMLSGPDYTGPIPGGVIEIPMPSNEFIMIFRIDKYSSGGEDQIIAGQLFRSELKMEPLCAFTSSSCPTDVPPGGTTLIVPEIFFSIPFKTIADTLIKHNPIEFLRQLQIAVAAPQTPPLSPYQQELSEQFNELFGEGFWSSKSSFARGAQVAHKKILKNYLTNRGPTQWIHFQNIGNWGDNALDRSSITEFIQYGNDISAAAYYHTFNDSRGSPLVGSRPQGYILHFPAGTLPDAKRFWSITAYTPNSIELIKNPADKYLVASYTPGLQYNSDNSLTIYISQNKPANAPEANWLPVSDRKFNIMLRVYGVVSGSSVAENTYVPPPIKRYNR